MNLDNRNVYFFLGDALTVFTPKYIHARMTYICYLHSLALAAAHHPVAFTHYYSRTVLKEGLVNLYCLFYFLSHVHLINNFQV